MSVLSIAVPIFMCIMSAKTLFPMASISGDSTSCFDFLAAAFCCFLGFMCGDSSLFCFFGCWGWVNDSR